LFVQVGFINLYPRVKQLFYPGWVSAGPGHIAPFIGRGIETPEQLLETAKRL